MYRIQRHFEHHQHVVCFLWGNITGLENEKYYFKSSSVQQLHRPRLVYILVKRVTSFIVRSVVFELSGAPDSSSGVVTEWAQVSSIMCVLDGQDTCFVLRAIGLVCCVMHVKEPSTLIVVSNNTTKYVTLLKNIKKNLACFCSISRTSPQFCYDLKIPKLSGNVGYPKVWLFPDVTKNQTRSHWFKEHKQLCFNTMLRLTRQRWW